MPDAPLHVFTSEDAAQLRASEVYTSGDVLQLRGGSPRKQREALSETAVLEFPEEQAAVDTAAEAEAAAKAQLKEVLPAHTDLREALKLLQSAAATQQGDAPSPPAKRPTSPKSKAKKKAAAKAAADPVANTKKMKELEIELEAMKPLVDVRRAALAEARTARQTAEAALQRRRLVVFAHHTARKMDAEKRETASRFRLELRETMAALGTHQRPPPEGGGDEDVFALERAAAAERAAAEEAAAAAAAEAAATEAAALARRGLRRPPSGESPRRPPPVQRGASRADLRDHTPNIFDVPEWGPPHPRSFSPTPSRGQLFQPIGTEYTAGGSPERARVAPRVLRRSASAAAPGAADAHAPRRLSAAVRPAWSVAHARTWQPPAPKRAAAGPPLFGSVATGRADSVKDMLSFNELKSGLYGPMHPAALAMATGGAAGGRPLLVRGASRAAARGRPAAAKSAKPVAALRRPESAPVLRGAAAAKAAPAAAGSRLGRPTSAAVLPRKGSPLRPR